MPAQINSHWANLIHSAMTRACFYRPKAPYNDWMASCAEGKEAPVEPSVTELATLDVARNKLMVSKQCSMFV